MDATTIGNVTADGVNIFYRPPPPPEMYHLDQALLDRPGGRDRQLDLLCDYRTNVACPVPALPGVGTSATPEFRSWPGTTPIFVPPGPEAFVRHVSDFELRFLDAGHFARAGDERGADGRADIRVLEEQLEIGSWEDRFPMPVALGWRWWCPWGR
ncbi:hypothetical protein F4809DRAFT_646204 [Biscogniauxia mediterranea]|nr:hypothetical protein F4809DRAFT_646204 [Biscogniauxia mediterranea]